MRRAVLLTALLAAGCAETVVALLSDDERAAVLDTVRVPASRPFALGFTPWPHGFTDTAESAADDAFLVWRDTGLLDGDGVPRLGLDVWDRWRVLPRR